MQATALLTPSAGRPGEDPRPPPATPVPVQAVKMRWTGRRPPAPSTTTTTTTGGPAGLQLLEVILPEFDIGFST